MEDDFISFSNGSPFFWGGGHFFIFGGGGGGGLSLKGCVGLEKWGGALGHLGKGSKTKTPGENLFEDGEKCPPK